MADQTRDDSSPDFIREILCGDKVLRINQLYIGDVGCVVWDAALVLAKFLEHPKYFPPEYLCGKMVLELGAGTGAVGLAACVLGADVVLTDLKSCLELMRQNINNNITVLKGKADAQVLEWGRNTSEFQPLPDIILMADLIYYEEVLQKLVDTVFSLSTPETLVYMSYEIRATGNKPKLQATFFKVYRYLF